MLVSHPETPVQVLVPPLPIWFHTVATQEAVEDGPNSWTVATPVETRMESVAPGFGFGE